MLPGRSGQVLSEGSNTGCVQFLMALLSRSPIDTKPSNLASPVAAGLEDRFSAECL
jgi:hypothetical protein